MNLDTVGVMGYTVDVVGEVGMTDKVEGAEAFEFMPIRGVSLDELNALGGQGWLPSSSFSCASLDFTGLLVRRIRPLPVEVRSAEARRASAWRAIVESRRGHRRVKPAEQMNSSGPSSSSSIDPASYIRMQLGSPQVSSDSNTKEMFDSFLATMAKTLSLAPSSMIHREHVVPEPASLLLVAETLVVHLRKAEEEALQHVDFRESADELRERLRHALDLPFDFDDATLVRLVSALAKVEELMGVGVSSKPSLGQE